MNKGIDNLLDGIRGLLDGDPWAPREEGELVEIVPKKPQPITLSEKVAAWQKAEDEYTFAAEAWVEGGYDEPTSAERESFALSAIDFATDAAPILRHIARNLKRYSEAIADTYEKADGDSNDDEIESLQNVRDMLEGLVGLVQREE